MRHSSYPDAPRQTCVSSVIGSGGVIRERQGLLIHGASWSGGANARMGMVLRLRFEVGLGLRQIARGCSIGLGTVHAYLQRAEAAGVTWPLGEDWDEERLEAALFGCPPRESTLG